VAQPVKRLISAQVISQDPGIQPHIGPPTQQGVWLSLSLCPSPCLCSLSLFLSQINKIFKKREICGYAPKDQS